jgi:D-3-phosphoglycerate dehydrogenase
LQEAGVLLCDESITSQRLSSYKMPAGLKVIGIFGKVQSRKLSEAACANGIIIFDDSKYNPRNFDFIPKRVIAFMNEGKTHTSCNFPDLQPPRSKQCAQADTHSQKRTGYTGQNKRGICPPQH